LDLHVYFFIRIVYFGLSLRIFLAFIVLNKRSV